MAGEARGRRPVTDAARPRRRWRLVLARRPDLPALVRRLFARARRHRSRVLLALGAGVLAVAVVIAALVVVYQTSAFAVRDVRVDGSRALAADVRTAAAVPPGTPLADVDLAATARRVRTLPPVRTAVVSREWPHTVVVTVTERTPAAAVPQGHTVRLVDATGVVFRTVASAPRGLPTIQVAHPGPADDSTRAALTVLAALTPKLRADLRRIEVPRPTRVTLRLSDGRSVVWGDASRSDRKAAAATALLSQDGSTIDVSAPDLVTVR
ncbi:cell division protein FtsQ/DivIB [Actinocatenispora rupis]|uniref:Cell division protein FtsQ n=1 Tax=Actinocatenispora rupis TaxID=519421 RepID=A0A8J3IZK9_9ACTN|nr:FtsQ-type POTRA domain-containing protein [Actinocatenispora rupis]GID09295.1 hypothetical protein Aru02nite_01840 [Actinocatenispora rupis]